MYMSNTRRCTVFSFFTIEKERTLRVFKRFGTDEIRLGPGSLKLQGNGILDIHLPGTIVGEQREYLVELHTLYKYVEIFMKGAPVVMNIYDLPDSLYIMSDEEKMFSSMYVTGEIIMLPKVHDNTPILPEAM
jgi:hypothetical protein